MLNTLYLTIQGDWQKLTLKNGNITQDPRDRKRKMEVRDYYLNQDRDTLNINGGPSVETIEFGDGVAKKPSKGMIWLFEKDRGRFFQSLDPVLPAHSEVNEAFWSNHKIGRNILEAALEVCQETYLEGSAEEWSSASPEARFVLGGTRCAKKLVGETLVIGFRGSDSSMDWRDNALFSLVGLEGEDSIEKVHHGFKVRAANIFKQHLVALIPTDLPKKIVVTGHSLGGAISQLVYVQLKTRIMEQRNIEDFQSEVLNVTFASPLVGNLQFRERLMQMPENLAENMFHFVVDEDVVPPLLFYKHAYEKIPSPKFFASKRSVLQKVLKVALGVDLESLPPEAQTLDKPSMYEQPVYDSHPEEAMEPYAPVGNYLYVKGAGEGIRLHQIAFTEDPQYVAQALISSLKILRRMGSLDLFVGKSAVRHAASKMPVVNSCVDRVHPLVTKIMQGHAIMSYRDKIGQLMTL